VNAEAESAKEKHNQLPSVEDVSEYRWPEKEEVSNDLGCERTIYLGDGDTYGV
jgi:hypothetical protein